MQQDLPEESKCQKCAVCFFVKSKHYLQTPKSLRNLSIFCSVVCILLMITTIVLVVNVRNTKVLYARTKKCANTQQNTEQCSLSFNISSDMQPPVYLLYYIDNDYINHQKYLESFSYDQLNGKTISVQQAQKQCKPIIYNRDLPVNVSWGGVPLNPDDIASPCGLKPMLFFNDTFKLYTKNGNQIEVNQSGIYTGKAIDNHRQPNSEQTQWIDPEDEHFKLFLRDGSLMTKKKLWGKIDIPLAAGEYNLVAENRFQIQQMNLHKGIQLSTASAMGGRNLVLPISFGIAAFLCIAYAILLQLKLVQYDDLIRQSLKLD